VSARDKVTFLEGLLERVRRNASQPRRRAPVAVVEVAEAPVAAAAVPAPVPPPPAPPPPETVKIEEPVRHVVATPPVTDIAVSEPDATVEVVEVLDDAEIVDITIEEEEEVAPRPPPVAPPPAPSSLAAAAPSGKATDIDFDEDDDRPPSSSRRPKLAASSLDEALSGAASQLEDEHEVPIKTPPPESGPQEALPPPQVLQQPPLELDEPGMEAELARSPRGPAPEQVGNTIELEEPAGPALELDSLPAESGPQLGRSTEELEAELSPAKPTPLPAASIESEPAPELTSAVVPVSTPISVPTEPREQVILPAATSVEPQVVQRSALPADVQVPAFVRAHSEFAPTTFLDLLEASLKLGS
jgi:hypothetical protein